MAFSQMVNVPHLKITVHSFACQCLAFSSCVYRPDPATHHYHTFVIPFSPSCVCTTTRTTTPSISRPWPPWFWRRLLALVNSCSSVGQEMTNNGSWQRSGEGVRSQHQPMALLESTVSRGEGGQYKPRKSSARNRGDPGAGAPLLTHIRAREQTN